MLKSIYDIPNVTQVAIEERYLNVSNLQLPEPEPALVRPGPETETGRREAGAAPRALLTQPRPQRPERRRLGSRGRLRTAGCTCPGGGSRSPRHPRPSVASCWAGPGRRGRQRRRKAAGCRGSPRSGRQQVA